ncbi:MAG: hypothetical protein M3436_09065 [Pseudomonadota bacterium]|nr:hypothetical protein [Pseudomonadota bacterium]
MKTRFIFSLTATLWSLGLTQPALSATPDSGVVILQCGVAGDSFDATAASESRGIRKVVINNECARELELYLRDGFKIRSTLGDQSGFIVIYTLIGPP